MQEHHDMNTILANKRVEWGNRADAAERHAKRCDADAAELDRGRAGMGDGKRREAEGHREEARKHRERAEAAGKGLMLVHRDDHKFQLEHHELIGRAAHEGRITFDDGDAAA